MNIVGSCPKCGSPQGIIGWLCGHNGDEEHDEEQDMYGKDWAKRMGIVKKDNKEQEQK